MRIYGCEQRANREKCGRFFAIFFKISRYNVLPKLRDKKMAEDNKYNKFRIEWDCRRGMLELDNVIMPFFRQHFDDLPEPQKAVFVRLLACTDLQLFSWFFNRVAAPDDELQQMIAHIQLSLGLSE